MSVARPTLVLEGLLQLVQDYRPHIEDRAVCTRCMRRDGALVGAEMNLCLSCVVKARAAAEAQNLAEMAAHDERIRAEYALLHGRAEAQSRDPRNRSSTD